MMQACNASNDESLDSGLLLINPLITSYLKLRYSRAERSSVNRWLKTGLLALTLGSVLTILAAKAEPHYPDCRFILFPGVLVADRWLKHNSSSAVFAFSVFAFDILIYSVVFGLILTGLFRIHANRVHTVTYRE